MLGRGGPGGPGAGGPVPGAAPGPGGGPSDQDQEKVALSPPCHRTGLQLIADDYQRGTFVLHDKKYIYHNKKMQHSCGVTHSIAQSCHIFVNLLQLH